MIIWMKEVLPVLLVIFVIVLALIIIARIAILFILERSYQKYLALKKVSKRILPKGKKHFHKEEEEKILENKAKQEEKVATGNIERIESEEEKQEKMSAQKPEIVDVIKPIGFWTAMILGQKLTYLVSSAQILNKRGDKGFWAAMVEAREKEAGRQHSRSR